MAMFEKKRMSAMHIQYINNSELSLPGYEMAGLHSINVFFYMNPTCSMLGEYSIQFYPFPKSLNKQEDGHSTTFLAE